MNYATISGIILGFCVLLFGILDTADWDKSKGTIDTVMLLKQLGSFFDVKSLSIVLLGSFAATMINFSFDKILGVFKVAANAFKKQPSKEIETVEELLKISKVYNNDGPRGLEKIIKEIKDPFLQNGLEMVSVETDNIRYKNFLESELKSMIERHAQGREILFNLGTYAPAFGMLGTVMGLILMMMANVGADSMDIDLTKVLTKMGLALRTTFYGVVLANLIFIPIAGKLKNMSLKDVYIREIMIEGLSCIHRKEHPIIIQDKLLAYLPINLKLKIKKNEKK